MSFATLHDGTKVHCIVRSEALVLDSHVSGYFSQGLRLKPGDIVLDVGANIGVFGVRTLQRVPELTVYAFEPVPEIFKTLQKNSELHGKGRIIPLPYGASSAPAQITLQYYPKSPALSTGHPEFWDNNPKMLEQAVEGALQNAPEHMWYARWIPTRISKWVARWLRSGAQSVLCNLVTISAIIEEYDIEHIDLLKIDCEGAELEALKGIQDEHWSRIQHVIAEVHDIDGRLDEVLSLVKKHGLTQVIVEKEPGFEHTPLCNVHAMRHRTSGMI